MTRQISPGQPPMTEFPRAPAKTVKPKRKARFERPARQYDVHVKFTEDQFTLLAAIANDEGRPLANLVRRVIVGWLDTNPSAKEPDEGGEI